MSEMPQVVFDTPWLLVVAVMLPLAVWLLRRVRARRRGERLARFAEPGALGRLLRSDRTGPGARTLRLVTVATLAGMTLYAYGDTAGDQPMLRLAQQAWYRGVRMPSATPTVTPSP